MYWYAKGQGIRSYANDLTIQEYSGPPLKRLICDYVTTNVWAWGIWKSTNINDTATNNSSRQWASYQIRKIVGCACAGNVSPRRRIQRTPRVADPGMHHGTCVTHVSWCMPGLLTRGGGENVPGVPGACAPVIWRIWQEDHSHEVATEASQMSCELKPAKPQNLDTNEPKTLPTLRNRC